MASDLTRIQLPGSTPNALLGAIVLCYWTVPAVPARNLGCGSITGANTNEVVEAADEGVGEGIYGDASIGIDEHPLAGALQFFADSEHVDHGLNLVGTFGLARLAFVDRDLLWLHDEAVNFPGNGSMRIVELEPEFALDFRFMSFPAELLNQF